MKKIISVLFIGLLVAGVLSAKDVIIPFNPSEGEERIYESTITFNIPGYFEGTYTYESGLSVAEKTAEGFKLKSKNTKDQSFKVKTVDGDEILLDGDEIESFAGNAYSGLLENDYDFDTSFFYEFQDKIKEISADTRIILDSKGNFLSLSNEDELVSAYIEYINSAYGAFGLNKDPSVATITGMMFNKKVLSDFMRTVMGLSYEKYGKTVPLKKNVSTVVSFPFFFDGVNISFKGKQKVTLDKKKNYNIASEFKYSKADLMEFIDSAIEPVVYNFLVPISLSTGEEISDEDVAAIVDEARSSLSEYADEIPDFEIVIKKLSVIDGTTGLVNSDETSVVFTSKNPLLAAYSGACYTLKQIAR